MDYPVIKFRGITNQATQQCNVHGWTMFNRRSSRMKSQFIKDEQFNFSGKARDKADAKVFKCDTFQIFQSSKTLQ
jgi:hypothetical protein